VENYLPARAGFGWGWGNRFGFSGFGEIGSVGLLSGARVRVSYTVGDEASFTVCVLEGEGL